MSDIESINELNPDLFEPEETGASRDSAKARKKAMDYLARREHGRHELVQKLIAAGFDSETAGETVSKLAGEGLQDDRRFVESYVRSRINQGKGPLRIRQELGERDVGDDMIDEALEDAAEDWFALAIRVRQKKFGPELPGEFREKARQMRFLQYRGFDSAQIQTAVSVHGDE